MRRISRKQIEKLDLSTPLCGIRLEKVYKQGWRRKRIYGLPESRRVSDQLHQLIKKHLDRVHYRELYRLLYEFGDACKREEGYCIGEWNRFFTEVSWRAERWFRRRAPILAIAGRTERADALFRECTYHVRALTEAAIALDREHCELHYVILIRLQAALEAELGEYGPTRLGLVAPQEAVQS